MNTLGAHRQLSPFVSAVNPATSLPSAPAVVLPEVLPLPALVTSADSPAVSPSSDNAMTVSSSVAYVWFSSYVRHGP